MRRVARVDVNQAQIVQALRKAGAEVTHLHTLGRGVADILASFKGHWVVMELKRDAKAKLTPDEARWIGKQRAPVFIVTSPMEAINFLNSIKP